MTPRTARRVLAFFSRLRPAQRDYGLTPREQEILGMLVQGLIKKEIGHGIGVSLHTVDMHLRRIYLELQVHTATGAVAKALKERLVQDDVR